jgi:hypothetical protein
MQEHLCRTLAHFIVYLASHLNLPLSRKAEQALLTASPTSWRIMTRIPDEWHKRELEALSASSGSEESYNSAEPSTEFDRGLDAQDSLREPEVTQPSLPPVVDYFKVSNCESFPRSFCIPHSIRQDPPLDFNAMQTVENPDLERGMMPEPSTLINNPEMNITPASDQELWNTTNLQESEHIELRQEMDYSAVEFEDDLDMSELPTPTCPKWPNFFADGPNFTIPRPPPIPISSM